MFLPSRVEKFALLAPRKERKNVVETFIILEPEFRIPRACVSCHYDINNFSFFRRFEEAYCQKFELVAHESVLEALVQFWRIRA